jgi:hypothetical protein
MVAVNGKVQQVCPVVRFDEAASIAGWAVQHSTWATDAACTHAGRVGSWPPPVGRVSLRRGVLLVKQAAVTAAGCCGCLLVLSMQCSAYAALVSLGQSISCLACGSRKQAPREAVGLGWVGGVGAALACWDSSAPASISHGWDRVGWLSAHCVHSQYVYSLLLFATTQQPPTGLLPTGCVCQ